MTGRILIHGIIIILAKEIKKGLEKMANTHKKTAIRHRSAPVLV